MPGFDARHALPWAALGLPVGPALALSLVRGMREILVGLVGLTPWRLAVR